MYNRVGGFSRGGSKRPLTFHNQAHCDVTPRASTNNASGADSYHKPDSYIVTLPLSLNSYRRREGLSASPTQAVERRYCYSWTAVEADDMKRLSLSPSTVNKIVQLSIVLTMRVRPSPRKLPGELFSRYRRGSVVRVLLGFDSCATYKQETNSSHARAAFHGVALTMHTQPYHRVLRHIDTFYSIFTSGFTLVRRSHLSTEVEQELRI